MGVLNRLALLLPILFVVSAAHAAGPASNPQEHEVVRIWPAQAPGTEDWKAPEEDADVNFPSVGKIHVITNVTVPTITIFRPARGKSNGTAMVVLPGGSFRALAWDVDGLETAQWLASKGITAFVLKYRVRPPQNGESFGETLDEFARATRERRAIAVADAEQAIRLIRSNAGKYGVVPDRVGIIGFSAGAMAIMDVALATDASVRPNFAVPMYGAALSDNLPTRDAPPLFIGAAQDDPQLPVLNSVDIFRKWTQAGIPAELHIYERGGHGFGFRTYRSTSDSWPAAFQAWLAARGYLKRP